jgi:hypothetical protein
MTNLPILSPRAHRALQVLGEGGLMVERLERDDYTGREQFKTRFCTSAAWSSVVAGLGPKTRHELERAGFRFVQVYRSSVSTAYKLDPA